ncbi:uncharacterized protein LOC129883756 [Solanum dulcamara]|uniref:uncharacterized protein LOC129883756 n=1 Tax=Solanum dulcamara TaxID=45834 RepID=UPI0024861E6C|nr:uncharacterized protein LOC129883756 [Solanum dulcamara]
MIMNRRMIDQCLLMVFLCLSYDGVRGTKLSKQEDLELEKQLKVLNKPPIKTIKTKYGDIYDCVNFYEQPAFNHPLLKNHNYHPQMKPSLSMKESVSTISTSNYKLSRIECPVGTVPIRRTTKEDLMRHKLMPPPEDVMVNNSLIRRENSSDLKRRYKPLKGYKIAIVHTEDFPGNKFGGAGVITNVYNPHVEGQQHSACRLKLIKETNIIQVGWRVDPTLYGDNLTRLFIHFTDGKTSSCFNLFCPAFVLLNTQIPIDGVFDPVSERGGNISDIGLSINWDLKEGNWWLFSTESNTPFGFWPREVFDDDFAHFATRVEWGGVVYSPQGILEPPMGSSFFPIENDNYDAFCKNMTLLSDRGERLFAVESQLSTYIDNSDLYNVLTNPGLMYYGGPGEQ